KNLTPKERRAIGKVNLTFPLIVPKQNAPINFYATNQPRGILMPILSVKLFDDVAIASAWLMFNGYSQNTVYDYMSIIKYNNPKSFPGHRYPLPLKALQIPANALKDSRVDSLSQQILKSAIVFILAHELGHLRYNHPGYDIPLDQARKNELEADDFALELMRRIGVPPFGMTHFFLTAFYMSVHRGDFSSDKEWEIYLREKSTHPLSPGRIRGLTSKLRKHRRAFARTQPDLNKGIKQINYIALQLDGIADILGDKKIQKR
ncbi:MAG: hypothetical protein GY699_01800, partial [Desulfobacteraceae bacterium]|nr:hypothetical protein [Desulfobacteraceae bacterium]